jgi:hypothetical protein
LGQTFYLVVEPTLVLLYLLQAGIRLAAFNDEITTPRV